MKLLMTAVCGAMLAAIPFSAFASNACKAPAIVTTADVTTSDGSEYRVETFYRSPKEAAATFITDAATTMVAEGAFAWSRQGETETLAGDNEKRFVIGHQFHALAFYFEEIATDIKGVTDVRFNGRDYAGLQGDYPHGGTLTLLQGAEGRPYALILKLPEESEITVAFDDWRASAGDKEIPYALTITHEGREFDYRYADVSFFEGANGKDAVDFHDAIAAPAIDEINIHRLHRALMTAHCRGDAGMMAALTAPQTVIANRGEVFNATSEQTGERFASVFSRVDYTDYHDLKDPAVEVSQSGDIGWIVVNPLAQGREIESGETFSLQWAWVMLVRKIDGDWLSAGNASNLKQPAE